VKLAADSIYALTGQTCSHKDTANHLSEFCQVYFVIIDILKARPIAQYINTLDQSLNLMSPICSSLEYFIISSS
jgi:hypothetical protein